jgi:hypothetical protein
MSNPKNKFEPKPIKNVLQDIVGQKALKKGVQNVRICNAWGKVVGENIMQYTDQVRFSHNILYVSLHSAPLKMELSYGLETLTRQLNEHIGSEEIRKIVLT